MANTGSKINNSNALNRTSGTVKAGGTRSTNFNVIVDLQGDRSVLGGDSSNPVNASSDGYGKFISGSGVGAPDTIKSFRDLAISRKTTGVGQNALLTDRALITTASGLRMLNDGRWISATGALVTPGTILKDLERVDGGGDTGSVNGRNGTNSFYVRVAKRNIEGTIARKTQ